MRAPSLLLVVGCKKTSSEVNCSLAALALWAAQTIPCGRAAHHLWDSKNLQHEAMPLGLESLFRAVTKRARRGLYAGKRVLSGNNVSDDGGNRCRRLGLSGDGRLRRWAAAGRERPDWSATLPLFRCSPAVFRPACRTRRMWKPNSQNKRLYSEILDKMVQLRVTTAALRCEGGHVLLLFGLLPGTADIQVGSATT